tara:strand:- start:9569 stop:10687 length:1119 start_codon:yes stop_codon:yes gene_type:complete
MGNLFLKSIIEINLGVFPFFVYMSVWNETDWNNFILYPVCGWLIGFILVGTFHKKLISFLKDKGKEEAKNVVSLIERPLSLLIILLATQAGIEAENIKISESVDGIIEKTFLILLTITLARLAKHVLDFVFATVLEPIAKKSEGRIDDQIIGLLKNSSGGLIWIIAGTVIISGFGYDVKALVAGLGIGGLAFAFAAKDTLAQAFGGIVLFMDRPFEVGDSVEIDGVRGDVEEIGLRSTKLRGLDKTAVIIPNATVASATITNRSRRSGFRQEVMLGLVYDTPIDLIKKAKTTLEEIIKKHPETKNKCWVNLLEFADSSLNLEVVYWIKKKSGGDLRKVRHEINITILEEFNNLGLDFAFPTTTIDWDSPKES